MRRFLFSILAVLILAGQSWAGFADFNFGYDFSGNGSSSRLAFYTPLTSTLDILTPGTTGGNR